MQKENFKTTEANKILKMFYEAYVSYFLFKFCILCNKEQKF
jgi:hypothetical protein